MLTVSSALYLVCKLIDFFTENISTRCFRDERINLLPMLLWLDEYNDKLLLMVLWLGE